MIIVLTRNKVNLLTSMQASAGWATTAQPECHQWFLGVEEHLHSPNTCNVCSYTDGVTAIFPHNFPTK